MVRAGSEPARTTNQTKGMEALNWDQSGLRYEDLSFLWAVENKFES